MPRILGDAGEGRLLVAATWELGERCVPGARSQAKGLMWPGKDGVKPRDFLERKECGAPILASLWEEGPAGSWR